MPSSSDAWLRLVHTVSTVESEIARMLTSRHGIGLSEYRALQALAKAPDRELRMQDLATHLQLNQSSISRMVERMERSGLTVRDVCADDKRGVFSVITEKGEARLEEARADYETALASALKESGLEGMLAAIPAR
ncbi:MarR family transcriptional regulator [Nitratireductor aquimarinus]|uniref:MarR family winged helix-turn-helix transcriptional regulator n=1 Tax=Nitratireductor TaxID=245876 RepID=UPI0019D3C6F3|nr:MULTISPECIES: MarR family transcriptional regulator [Nitratireductor]MBN7777542.1 MarR family transcriptional regulator [Nitratireductor pacificus]MBN7781535.1 MarR family transcriptional regulator [Nitratireductor pacificus]MBN7790341.1 MarR family transcriptional regulator [Nitratireductor aquimarinus]MBY6099751.1 MarR family transcriptional regulator [Nitratireductor aquimarinus]MCA1262938.1 MarR family transcriptional regulator [Nitratireductor aquimarinus]